MPKLSSRTLITDPSDGELHIIKPDGVGGYDSYRITFDDLISLLQTQLDSAVSLIGNKRADINKSANFDFYLFPNTKLISFDIQQVSGTVSVKIGTTVGGDEILPELTFTTGTESITIDKYYAGYTDIYVTRISGTFNMVTYSKINWI